MSVTTGVTLIKLLTGLAFLQFLLSRSVLKIYNYGVDFDTSAHFSERIFSEHLTEKLVGIR